MGARDLVNAYCTYNAYLVRSLRLQQYQRQRLSFRGTRLQVRIYSLGVNKELTSRHGLYDPNSRTINIPMSLDDKFANAFLGGHVSLSSSMDDVQYLRYQRTIPKRNRKRGD